MKGHEGSSGLGKGRRSFMLLHFFISFHVCVQTQSQSRHRYHAATVRYGRQFSARRIMVFGFGRRFIPK